MCKKMSQKNPQQTKINKQTKKKFKMSLFLYFISLKHWEICILFFLFFQILEIQEKIGIKTTFSF